MYRCNDCHEVFATPDSRRSVEGHGETLVFDTCPSCGSDEVEAFAACIACTDSEAVDGTDYCVPCAKDELAPEEYAEIVEIAYRGSVSRQLSSEAPDIMMLRNQA